MSRRTRATRAAGTATTASTTAIIGKLGAATAKPQALTEEPGIVIEIDYDGAEAPPPRRGEGRHVDGTIKSAIIRWLNEQL